LAGGDRKADGEHGFPDSGRAQEGDVGSGLDELQGGQVVDLAGIQVRLEREVELVQGSLVGQCGGAQRVVEAASFADAEFFLKQQIDEVQVAHLVGFGAPGEVGDGLGEMTEAQRGGGGFDPVGGQLAH
jgi:hypothetical protein